MTPSSHRLDTDRVLKAFFEKLSTASHRVLMLDYDGTLAPFRVERLQAVPYPGVREILSRILAGGHARVVIVSGRPVAELLPLLGLEPLPEIWGAHGWERRLPDGALEVSEPDPDTREVLDKAYTAVVAEGLESQSERKIASVAVHWRGLDDDRREELRRRVLRLWTPVAEGSGLVIQEFDGGIELRVPGRSKADAVNTVLAETGPDPAAAYLGDDATDEDAFRAIQGKGIGILVRSEYRPTAASAWLRPPEELLDFLSRWLQISGGKT